MESKKVIIFVCVSNTCRSPMAEYLCRDILVRNGLQDDYIVQSRSLSTDYEDEGSSASIQGLDVMREYYGIDMSQHRSKLLSKEDVEKAFMIVPVKRDLGGYISHLHHGSELKVTYFAEDISDPWQMPVDVFRACAEKICILLDELLIRTGVLLATK